MFGKATMGRPVETARRILCSVVLLSVLAGCETDGMSFGPLKSTTPSGPDNGSAASIEMREVQVRAQRGDVSAQYDMAIASELKALKDPGRYREAAKWYTLAAEQGHLNAQYNLAMIYENGLLGQPDNAKAVELYQRAAEQGHGLAQYHLGQMYEEGRGVRKDPVAAGTWFKKAEEQGVDLARLAYARIQTKLPKDSHQSPYPTEPDVVEEKPAPKPKPPKMVSMRPPPGQFPRSPLEISYGRHPVRPHDIAVIIGNANYTNFNRDIPNVVPAYADAASFREYAINMLGVRVGNIIHMEDATGNQMAQVFGSATNPRGQLYNWIKPGQSNVTVYFAGHGAPSLSDGSAFLLPVDANPELVEVTGFPLQVLYNNLGKLPAKSVTVVLEACFSGTSSEGSVVRRASGIYARPKTASVPANLKVVSAGTADQIASWDTDNSSSLFTKFYLLGMAGEADKRPHGNGDGTVGIKELQSYLDDNLTYLARRYYGRTQTAQITVGDGVRGGS